MAIDVSLVRALLQQQHPDLAVLPLTDIGGGWDNRVFRLGTELAVRLPCRSESAGLVEHEQRWLPAIAPLLPVAIPVPVRIGRPGSGFPWRWSVVPWLPGTSALESPYQAADLARTLGRFLHALHRPAPRDAPENPWRGIPLAARDEIFHEHLHQAPESVDRAAAHRLWREALSIPPWPGPPLWIHGDLHPGNLVITRGSLSAVIDFGDLTAGDPATDLAVIWMLFSPAERDIFVNAARSLFNECATDTLARARAWALALGLSYMTSPQSDEALRAIGFRTIQAALIS